MKSKILDFLLMVANNYMSGVGFILLTISVIMHQILVPDSLFVIVDLEKLLGFNITLFAGFLFLYVMLCKLDADRNAYNLIKLIWCIIFKKPHNNIVWREEWLN